MSSKIINSTLYQKNNTKGDIRNFEIYNDKFLKVQTHNLFGNKSYHINLSILEPWPVHHRYIAWRWVLAFCYFFLSTLTFGVYFFTHQQQTATTHLSIILMIFFLLSLVTLLFAIYQSANVTEFRSRYGNCPLISMMQNNPDKKTFSQFVGEIKTRSLTASQHVTFDKKQMLSFELQEIQRLKNDGSLSKRQYEKARERLMKVHI